MTTVTFFKRKDGLITGFQAEGHAGWADYGQDIVCAAVSSLTQSAWQGLEQVVGAKVESRIEPEKGLLRAMLTADQPDDIMEKAQILLKTLEMALTGISNDKQYSGTVRIMTRERR